VKQELIIKTSKKSKINKINASHSKSIRLCEQHNNINNAKLNKNEKVLENNDKKFISFRKSISATEVKKKKSESEFEEVNVENQISETSDNLISKKNNRKKEKTKK
jgi:hypothetical protein